MKTWNTFATNTNADTTSNNNASGGTATAAPSTGNLKWLDVAYAGFIVVAIAGLIACLFI